MQCSSTKESTDDEASLQEQFSSIPKLVALMKSHVAEQSSSAKVSPVFKSKCGHKSKHTNKIHGTDKSETK